MEKNRAYARLKSERRWKVESLTLGIRIINHPEKEWLDVVYHHRFY
ncbi:hypothetical protein [Methanosarcina sp. 1.H.A.2.2]|nr:hypothetical protein [Methanosarcina sp. 1.H.A.2.2]